SFPAICRTWRPPSAPSRPWPATAPRPSDPEPIQSKRPVPAGTGRLCLAGKGRRPLQKIRREFVQFVDFDGGLIVGAVGPEFFFEDAAAGAQQIGQAQLVVGQQD